MPGVRRRKVFRCILFALLSVVGLWLGVNLVFPNISRLKKQAPKTTAFMKYRQKAALKIGKKPVFVSVWMPLEKISPYLVQAVVISEDDKFWSHKGFDFKARNDEIKHTSP